MEDEDVLSKIQELAHEEHQLLEAEGSGTLEQSGHDRLRAIEVALDRCWDLLRQRRARRSAGLDPDESQARDADTVEHYRQ